MTILWASITAYFLSWWFQPSHYTDFFHFAFDSFIVFWSIILPGYYFYFLNRVKRPNPALQIPADWRIAMVATKATSEPFELAVKMLKAMKAQDLQADVWLADEDPTPQMRAWCEENGVYLSTRKGVAAYHKMTWPRRTRCKEGNLAYFYDHYGYERYDFVAQMDADHIPTPGYLRAMIQPFLNPEVGYVSAPSICDANAKESWVARGRLYLEGTLHGTLQAGYHGGWLPMCIGSHYTVRTKALKEVGGLGPELAEDHSTTLLMAAGGWKGIHSIDAEAHGDGPPSFAAGMIQEFQWARSLIMIFLEMTPRVLHKLPLRLKFQFLFGQLWYFLFSFAMLSAFALPVIGLIDGNSFANVTYLSYILHAAPTSIAALLIVYRIKSWGLLRPTNAKVLSWEMVAFQLARWPWVIWAVIDAFKSTFFKVALDWKVTPKTKDKTDIAKRFLAPYVGISAISTVVALSHIGSHQIGFFWLALFNAVNYLWLAVAIIKLHARENGHYNAI
jgi:cellulose synthase/poly-beta-1,6-N-acetylglucosamine synthase-like glycosyltransferase